MGRQGSGWTSNEGEVGALPILGDEVGPAAKVEHLHDHVCCVDRDADHLRHVTVRGKPTKP